MKKVIIKTMAALIITVLSVGFFARADVEARTPCLKVCPPHYECEWEGDEKVMKLVL